MREKDKGRVVVELEAWMIPVLASACRSEAKRLAEDAIADYDEAVRLIGKDEAENMMKSFEDKAEDLRAIASRVSG